MGLGLILRKRQHTKTHLGGPEVDGEHHAEGAKVPEREKMKFGQKMKNEVSTYKTVK